MTKLADLIDKNSLNNLIVKKKVLEKKEAWKHAKYVLISSGIKGLQCIFDKQHKSILLKVIYMDDIYCPTLQYEKIGKKKIPMVKLVHYKTVKMITPEQLVETIKTGKAL